MTKLIENNLYILDTPNFRLSFSLFTGINPETLRFWHPRLEHLEKQNILQLTTMLQGIDLSKPPPIHIYSHCSQAKMHVESHKDRIEPDQYSLDLIYSNVSGHYI